MLKKTDLVFIQICPILTSIFKVTALLIVGRYRRNDTGSVIRYRYELNITLILFLVRLGSAEEAKQLELWTTYIKWEQSNPLKVRIVAGTVLVVCMAVDSHLSELPCIASFSRKRYDT